MRLPALALVAMPLIACGGDSAESTGTAAATSGSANDSSIATQGDATTQGVDTTGGGMVDPTPILEREPALSHTCAQTRPMTQLPGATSGRADALLTTGGNYFALRSFENLTLAGISLDGTIGDEVVLEAEAFAARGATAAVVGNDIATVWTYGGPTDSVLRFTAVDDTLVTVVAPKDISGLAATYLTAAALVPLDSGGLALFYGESDSGGDTRLRFVELDDQGDPLAAPVDVGEGGPNFGAISASAVVTADGGYAVAFIGGQAGQGEVRFVMLDGDGTPRFAPQRISRAATDGWSSEFGFSPRPNLLGVGDRYWVAFTEASIDNDAMQGDIVIRLAVVDDQGHAESHLLQAPLEGRNNLWPSLSAFDDRIAVMWTSGTIIWVCGGCIADNDLHFVLLDPDAIVPASEVVTQLHENNGIVAPLVAGIGADLLTAASLDLHAVTLPATGALRCEPSG